MPKKGTKEQLGTILSEVKGFTPVIDVLAQELGLMSSVVYGIVWRYCQMQSRKCTASRERIAGHADISVKTVERHLRKLCKAGYLKDLTPTWKHRPHEYADTGKAKITGLLTVEVGETESLTSEVGKTESPGGETESPTRSDRESDRGKTESLIRKDIEDRDEDREDGNETDSPSSSPPSSSVSSETEIDWDAPVESPHIEVTIEKLSRTFRDRSVKSNISQARNLWARTSLTEADFVEALEEAAAIAKNTANVKNRMAYFFGVLRDKLEL